MGEEQIPQLISAKLIKTLSAASQAVPEAGRCLMREPAFSRGSAGHTQLKVSMVPCLSLISWPRYPLGTICGGEDEESPAQAEARFRLEAGECI